MKLQHLPLGARFEYEGMVFVKTGPLTASSEKGGQRIIPRYAMLKPLDGSGADDGQKSAGLDEAKVLKAFEAYHRTCSELLDEASRQQLEAARLSFLRALK